MTGRRPAGMSRRPRSSAPRPDRASQRRGPGWRERAWRAAWPPLAAGLLALVLHLPSLRYGYVRDDHDLIEHNPALASPAWLGSLLTSDFWASGGLVSGMWRPAVTASYVLDARAGGGTTRFHATNVVLHALTTACVTAVAAQAGAVPLAAALAGGWFGASPVHAECVAWVSGRTDVLCALFAIIALGLDRRSRKRGRAWPGVLATIAFLLALLSKETAMTWIAVLAVAAWVEARPPRQGVRAFALWMTPYSAVLAAYAVAHARFAGAMQIPRWLTPEAVQAQKLGAATVLTSLAARLVPGLPHAADRIADPPASPASLAFVLGAVITVGAVLLLAVRTLRRGRDAVPLAAFLMPLLSLVALAAATGYLTVAERNLYLPTVGVALGLALAVDAATRRMAPSMRRVPAWSAAALVGVSAVETAVVLPTWRNDRVMYEAIVRVQPRHAEARVGLANELINAGRPDEAAAQLKLAEAADPRHPAIPVTRALLAARREDWAGELAEARRALAIDPLRGDAWVHEASGLLHLGRLQEADSVLSVRWAASPRNPTLAALRGRTLMLLGRPAEALPLLESAAAWISDDPGLYAALGEAQFKQGRPVDARDSFERALRLEPGAYDVWLKLTVACLSTGDRVAADAALRRAEALPEASNGLAARMRQSLFAPGGSVVPPDPARPTP